MRKNFRSAIAIISCTTLLFQNAISQNTAPYWSLAGNNNATLANKIGTTNAVSLRLVTNNIERIKIHSGGNVGIGTSSPSHKLHVAGNARFTSDVVVDNGGIQATNTATGSVGISGSGELIGVSGSGSLWGVLGGSSNGAGVSGQSSTFTGVTGFSTSGVGTAGESGSGYGVYGISQSNTGVLGTSTDGYGGRFDSENDWGLRASTVTGTYAGVFYGKVWSSGGYVTSDKNLKQNIEEFSDAMTILNKLKPRHYEFKRDGQYAFLNLARGSHYGLLAQDVEEVLPDLVATADHRDLKLPKPKTTRPDAVKNLPMGARQTPDGKKEETISLKSVNYIELIPIMIKGMQEQEQRMQKQEQLLQAQQQQLEELKALVRQLTKNQGSNSGTRMGALQQAVPNPAKSTTRISYSLPAACKQAQLVIADSGGKPVKTVPVTASGIVDINTTMFSNGVYHYMLIADGNVIETKKLTVAR